MCPKPETFGPIVYQSDKYIVRVKETETGIQTVIHTVYEGIELMPFSYGEDLPPALATGKR